MSFSSDTAVTRVGPGSFTAELHERWSSLVGIHGGYTAAIVANAMTAAVDDPSRALRSFATQFASVPRPGPVDIEVTVGRTGKSMTTTSARLLQEGRVLQVAHAASSTARPGLAYDDHVRARDADPGDTPRFASSAGVGHFQNADVRLDPDAVPFSGGDQAWVAAWLRPLQGEPIDAAWLVTMCDLLPPAVFSRTTGPVKAATIEYVVHLATDQPSVPPGEYVYLSCRSPLSNEGFAVEDATMWAADGRVLAVARQTRLAGVTASRDVAPTVRSITQPAAEAGMSFEVAQIDEVLATTRAVRRRLDLERPVDNQLLLDCIDLAEQAPTGGNLGSRRWIIVREQRVKDQLGELYRETALPFMSAAAERLQGTDHPSEKVMASATYLAEHLAEVPAIVIPTVIGRHDGSGRPGLFDSVIQAAWSFCLALRARGLGTTWVTAALQDTTKVKEILRIPEDMTEIVLLPVAYTKGTDFKRAPRHPARSITYFDRFGLTAERGPSDELRFEDGPGAIAEVDIAASPATVWSLVSDINLPARFSNEFAGAEWESDDRGVGAMFHGHNQHAALGEWTIPCFIDTRDEPRAFGWRTSDPDNPGARWRFDLEPREGGTRLRFSYVMGPGPSGTTMAITNNPGKEVRVLRRRIGEVQANMQQTVEGVKQLAEETP